MAVYRVTNEAVLEQWQCQMDEYANDTWQPIAPGVGDYFQLVPCRHAPNGLCIGDACPICQGWLELLLDGQTGWVPAELVHVGCSWYYPPVVCGQSTLSPPTPPGPLPTTQLQLLRPPPRPLAPAQLSVVHRFDDEYYATLVNEFRSRNAANLCSPFEQFEAVQSDDAVWEALCTKALKYCDDYDRNIAERDKTSNLCNRMTFPQASLTGPVPVESFPDIDNKEWSKYNISTLTDMKAAGLGMSDFETQGLENMTHDMDGTRKRWFHGGCLGGLIGMIACGGGFIPGPGKCRKNSRSVQGAFCSDSFSTAFSKGMGHQLDYAVCAENGGKRLNMFCMPVVVEISPVNVHPTHMHGSKYCFETPPGLPERSVLPGVIITAFYINRCLLQSFFYLHIHEPRLRPDLQDPYKVRICGQSSSQYKKPIYQQTCGRILNVADWRSIHQSKTGIWYCLPCAEFICKNSGKIVYSLGSEQNVYSFETH